MYWAFAAGIGLGLSLANVLHFALLMRYRRAEDVVRRTPVPHVLVDGRGASSGSLRATESYGSERV